MSEIKVAWISAGVSSFVATYIARESIDEMLYIDIDDQHEDSLRFIYDCGKIIGAPRFLKSPYGSVENACRAGGCMRIVRNGWAPCTAYLKQRVRKEQFEDLHKDKHITYIWGFDCSERDRAERLFISMPNFEHKFPLIENNLTKQDCHAMCEKLGIKRPYMYDLGYSNNNCIACVKGGMGYFNKIRRDFPEVFKKRAELERELNARCLKECFLDELDPDRGSPAAEIMQECSIMCELALH